MVALLGLGIEGDSELYSILSIDLIQGDLYHVFCIFDEGMQMVAYFFPCRVSNSCIGLCCWGFAPTYLIVVT